MIRLNVIAEGQTEQTFVRDVLVEHLASHEVFVSVRCVETSRRGAKIFRGGVTSYQKAKGDLTLWMKEDQKADAYFTTMFDLYGLPKDFPGYEKCRRKRDPLARARAMEASFGKDIDHPRFVPYIQLHEFEALMFSGPEEFKGFFFDKPKEIDVLKAIAGEFESPEHIDDGDETAPSKRIAHVLPQYRALKPVAGPLIAMSIGLPVIRDKCAHFDEWITKLECLGR